MPWQPKPILTRRVLHQWAGAGSTGSGWCSGRRATMACKVLASVQNHRRTLCERARFIDQRRRRLAKRERRRGVCVSHRAQQTPMWPLPRAAHTHLYSLTCNSRTHARTHKRTHARSRARIHTHARKTGSACGNPHCATWSVRAKKKIVFVVRACAGRAAGGILASLGI